MDIQRTWLSIYDKKTADEMRRAVSNGIYVFGRSKMNYAIKAGDKMILVDIALKQIFGIANVIGSCIKPLLIDARNVYEDPKYNKCEIPSDKPFLFPRPLSYTEFLEDILHIRGVKTNLNSVSCHTRMTSPFPVYEKKFSSDTNNSPEMAEIQRRLAVWGSTYV